MPALAKGPHSRARQVSAAHSHPVMSITVAPSTQEIEPSPVYSECSARQLKATESPSLRASVSAKVLDLWPIRTMTFAAGQLGEIQELVSIETMPEVQLTVAVPPKPPRMLSHSRP
mmetsp:Transcript_16002/g.45539  ORF Transcript_16002/g.45539 Transcript_16002/m.45539 type:complete len:116 (-) Transcript_16002:346-693(-)